MSEDLKIQLDKKINELTILHRVAGIISSSPTYNEILTDIIEICVEITKAESCLIYIYDPNTDKLQLKASKNPHSDISEHINLALGEGITGWAASKKKPVSISEGAYSDPRFKTFNELPEDRYEAFLSIPILSGNELAGVINLQHVSKHQYPADQVELLCTIAKYLGSTVNSARARQEVEKKAELVNILSKVSGTIISNSYLKEILHLIVTMTAEVMNSKICSITLLDETKQELIIEATQSLSQEYINKPNIKLEHSVSGQAVRSKEAVIIKNVTLEKGYMYPDIAKKEGITSMLAVPMLIKDRVIGVITSYTSEEHNFTEDEINLLQSVANQAAVAIENTRLNEEVLKTKEELQSRKLIEKAKGILMKDLDISESEAYNKIRKKSMDLRKSMNEMAEAIVLADNLRILDK